MQRYLERWIDRQIDKIERQAEEKGTKGIDVRC